MHDPPIDYQKLPTLVSTGDIARMANVTPAAVVNWKSRYWSRNPASNPNQMPMFPKPIVTTGAGPLYDKKEILHWLQARKDAQA